MSTRLPPASDKAWLKNKMADEQEHYSPVLMILCGIPACGKTFLANSIKEWSKNDKETNKHVLHICYDNLIPSNLDLKSSLIEQKETLSCDHTPTDVRNSAWKHYRKLIIRCVERILMQSQNLTFGRHEESDVLENTSCELPSIQVFWQNFLKQTARKEMACTCLSTQKYVN
jgi:hypothetical protein